MSNKLRRVTAEKFKTALRAGREHIKNLLPCKASAAVIEKDVDNPLRQTWTISSSASDRDSDTIDQNGWELDAYKTNPVILWAHNHADILPPIGRSLATFVESGKLKSRAEFTPRDLNPFGFMIAQMAAQGFIQACSVGFMPKEWKENAERPGFMPLDFLRQELLEWSVCPVGSNREALLEARSKGIDLAPLAEYAEKALSRDDDSGLWLPRADIEAIYQASRSESAPAVSLPPAPVLETKNAPEPTTGAAASTPSASAEQPPAAASVDVVAIAKTMQAQTDQMVAGVTELVAKAVDAITAFATVHKQGRVLSSANESKLREARDLLSSVISQVDEEPLEDDAHPSSTKTPAPPPPPAVDYPAIAKAVGDAMNPDAIKHRLAEAVSDSVKQAIARARGRVD